MGATGWIYQTPYDPDPEIALHDLRQRIFESGDYLKPGEILRISNDHSLLPPMLPRFWVFLYAARAISAVIVALRWLARGGRGPRTIDEVLIDSRESGTHSILDIQGISDFPSLGYATPLSKQHCSSASARWLPP